MVNIPGGKKRKHPEPDKKYPHPFKPDKVYARLWGNEFSLLCNLYVPDIPELDVISQLGICIQFVLPACVHYFIAYRNK